MRPGPKGPARRSWVRTTLPFNMSRSLLNFLGYARDRADFLDARITRAQLRPPGERAALQQGLIEPTKCNVGVAQESEAVPFLPIGREREGYRLTRLGRQIADIGKRARQLGQDPTAGHWPMFIQEAQFTLDEAIRESNLRAA